MLYSNQGLLVMSQYLPTINLWNNGIETVLRNGALVLQCGQDNQKSRFISATKHHINVAHGANNKQVIERFMVRIEHERKRK